ncbi:MAG: hypothetical protein ABIT05_04665 [Chitinophagaceae bacterium]
MNRLIPLILLLSGSLSLHAQRLGNDTLPGYIVKTGTDTIQSKLVLAYKMIKEKKTLHKEYETEQWHKRAIVINAAGSTDTLYPNDISAYGIYLNHITQAVFRSSVVIIPHKGLLLNKGNDSRFLRMELEGPISLYLYRHTENGLGATTTYYDRYLRNEKGEMTVLKIKVWLGIAYNLEEVESWFAGYPELSKFKLKDMMAVEVWMLVDGYNRWREH